MQCPNDHADLATDQRHGIEIASCPTCQGLWLTRDQIEKFLDRATAPTRAGSSTPQPTPSYEQQPYLERPHRREQSWLSEVFA